MLRSSHARSRHNAARRLVGFSLLVFYVLVLVAAAWPRMLQPFADRLTTAQIVALQLMHSVGIHPGMELFTGQGRPRWFLTRLCLQITAHGMGGERVVLFDDFERCRQKQRRIFKDRFVHYQASQLELAFRHIETPGKHGNLNLFPLDHLFAITDYYCRRAPDKFDRVAIRTLEERMDYETGQRRQRTEHEGFRLCGEPKWVVR